MVTKVKIGSLPLAMIAALSGAVAPTLLAQPAAENTTSVEASQNAIEVLQIFASPAALDQATGSANVINSATLEQFEYDDIHRVLQHTPGVYIRQEDGYGLRPNIGLRGATTERSSKITLMEDGILLAPAPYAAPAAYFFPSVSRMHGVEVVKGAAAIRFGPNTIGGAINMLSTPIQEAGTGLLDMALGEQGYRKAHARYSHNIAGLDVMVDGIHLAADGFKVLPSGSDTGFEKNEVLTKIAYEPQGKGSHQRWLLKLGYADEVSNETYLGLTDGDFATDPYQRYAASENDKLDWEHLQLSLDHYWELSAATALSTQVYRRDFDRDWDRLNRLLSSRPIAAILAAPETGINTLLLAVLTGERDSLTPDETLLLTLNDRSYYSQGIQSKLLHERTVGAVELVIDAGLRWHQDRVARRHRDRAFLMRASQLVRAQQADRETLANRHTATAIAAYVDTQWHYGDLVLAAGARVEHIDMDAVDSLQPSAITTSDTALLPGFGLFYKINAHLGVLAGINKGFVPNSPGQTSAIDVEESWNYELGLRGSLQGWQGALIGFFNDYQNLKGTCTFSSGCIETLDQEFNAGAVDVSGIEFNLANTFTMAGLQVPVAVAYTYTHSEFETAFDASFSQWGAVEVGDALPYMPQNQVGVSMGLAGDAWRLELNYQYTDAMQEAAGDNTPLSGFKTDALSQWDLSAWQQWSAALRVYLKIDNLSDEQAIVSRRPFGARPNKPRQISVGVKYWF